MDLIVRVPIRGGKRYIYDSAFHRPELRRFRLGDLTISLFHSIYAFYGFTSMYTAPFMKFIRKQNGSIV